MKKESSVIHDVIMLGIGGKGVLLAGQLLAQAGINQYKHVLYFPEYGVFKRGGFSHCYVILSDKEIASPLLDQSEAIIVFEPSILGTCQDQVLPGGAIVVESAGLNTKVRRSDIRFVPVPAVETAAKMGNPQVANLILLGAYVCTCKAVSPQLVDAELDKMLAGKAKALALNKEAFHKGCELGVAKH